LIWCSFAKDIKELEIKQGKGENKKKVKKGRGVPFGPGLVPTHDHFPCVEPVPSLSLVSR
jgi:hypothetical protein